VRRRSIGHAINTYTFAGTPGSHLPGVFLRDINNYSPKEVSCSTLFCDEFSQKLARIMRFVDGRGRIHDRGVCGQCVYPEWSHGLSALPDNGTPGWNTSKTMAVSGSGVDRRKLRCGSVFAGLQLLYNSLVDKMGLARVREYRRLLKAEGVPLLLWRYATPRRYWGLFQTSLRWRREAKKK